MGEGFDFLLLVSAERLAEAPESAGADKLGSDPEGEVTSPSSSTDIIPEDLTDILGSRGVEAPERLGDIYLATHGVNDAMALKYPALWWQHSRDLLRQREPRSRGGQDDRAGLQRSPGIQDVTQR